MLPKRPRAWLARGAEGVEDEDLKRPKEEGKAGVQGSIACRMPCTQKLYLSRFTGLPRSTWSEGVVKQ